MLLGTQLKMSGLYTSVVIPSYELETSSPFTFWHKHSSIASQKETGYIAMQRSEDFPGQNAFSCRGVQLVKGRDFSLWEVARASSAAPTYFPSRLPCPPPNPLAAPSPGPPHPLACQRTKFQSLEDCTCQLRGSNLVSKWTFPLCPPPPPPGFPSPLPRPSVCDHRFVGLSNLNVWELPMPIRHLRFILNQNLAPPPRPSPPDSLPSLFFCPTWHPYHCLLAPATQTCRTNFLTYFSCGTIPPLCFPPPPPSSPGCPPTASVIIAVN